MSATDQTAADDAMVRGESAGQDQREADAARDALALTRNDDFTIPARQSWDTSQVAVIRQTVAKDCNQSELAMFLEVAVRYRLDPFLREIFAAKFNGANGPVTIFTGRDGMLKAARTNAAPGRGLRHMESHVVREMDHFEVEVDTTNVLTDEESGQTLSKLRRLHHTYRGMGTGELITDDQNQPILKDGRRQFTQRGPIIGAYALVFREGDEEPWFAQATWEDYGATKQQTQRGHDTNWTIGKGYTEAMMIKVPQSIGLRMAFGLAGLYGQEEVQKQLDQRADTRQDVSGGEGAAPRAAIKWPEGELGLTLEALVTRANELVPRSWPVPKVAMRVNGKTDEQLEALAGELRRFIGSRAPDDPLVAEAIPDAVVVDPDEDEVASEADREPEPEPEDEGPTVREELEAEPEPEPEGPPTPEGWSDALEAEYQEVQNAVMDLDTAAQEADSEEERARYVSNLEDAQNRLNQLAKVRKAAGISDS